MDHWLTANKPAHWANKLVADLFLKRSLRLDYPLKKTLNLLTVVVCFGVLCSSSEFPADARTAQNKTALIISYGLPRYY